jgi:hypothetical protein
MCGVGKEFYAEETFELHLLLTPSLRGLRATD